MIRAFLDWLHAQVGQIYVWGGVGEEMSPERITRMESDPRNRRRALALYEQRRAEGKQPILGYDCSGLVSRFLQDRSLVEKKRNANHLAAMCTEVTELTADSVLARGELLFRYNGVKPYFHVGVYVGDGMVIESKGRDEGVVLRPQAASGAGYWNRHGRLAVLEEAPYFGICSGGSVNLRSGPGSSYVRLATLHAGDKLLVNPREGWPQVAAVQQGEILVGYMAPRYIREADA